MLHRAMAMKGLGVMPKWVEDLDCILFLLLLAAAPIWAIGKILLWLVMNYKPILPVPD
jgi:hypothetical protein